MYRDARNVGTVAYPGCGEISFRRSELSRKFGGKILEADLREFSRHARGVAWTIARLEYYSMVLLAAGLIIPKIVSAPLFLTTN